MCCGFILFQYVFYTVVTCLGGIFCPTPSSSEWPQWKCSNPSVCQLQSWP